jgi:hypothetical protein
VKALAIRQPWAHAIVHAGKRIENRTWPTPFRGPFLIHAAKGCTRDEYLDAVHWMVSRGLARSPFFPLSAPRGVDVAALPMVPRLADLVRGGIVGRARIIEVFRPAPEGVPAQPWLMPGQYGFELADVEPLPFVPCRGMLGFFNAPADVVAQIGAAT